MENMISIGKMVVFDVAKDGAGVVPLLKQVGKGDLCCLAKGDFRK
ncbi:MAG: hypothetical protein AAF998_14475 [Bacteroidota bacterium]